MEQIALVGTRAPGLWALGVRGWSPGASGMGVRLWDPNWEYLTFQLPPD